MTWNVVVTWGSFESRHDAAIFAAQHNRAYPDSVIEAKVEPSIQQRKILTRQQQGKLMNPGRF